ncbi:DUF4892 domain-containing protein [Pseudomonas sp. NPDC007930]|uniref:DUF4892 domain-containing protein n=1 Tax=Pseudomonas sp. NPDC007930 TaxID=3364417 RepID=UPI0036E26664
MPLPIALAVKCARCIAHLGRAALALGVLAVAGAVQAAQPLEALLPQADGQVLEQRPAQAAERLYPLGALRKISGQLRMEGRVLAQGTVSSITYELPPERSVASTFAQAREGLRDPQAQVLFWCQGRDCGESSLWANEIFGNARLLGSDGQQAFLLVRQGPSTLLAVYAVTRGNRRVALHLERFEASQPLGTLLPTPATLLRELRESGQLNFAELGNGPDAPWVSVIARALNLDSALRVKVSGTGAQGWSEALEAQGVRAARLESDERTGPLALQWLR